MKPKPYVCYGPGGSGNYDTLEEAQAVFEKMNGKGAIYVRIDIVEDLEQSWARLNNRIRQSDLLVSGYKAEYAKESERSEKLSDALVRITKLVAALLDDIYEFGTPPPGRIFDELETMVREPTLTILNPDGTTTDVHPTKAWNPGDFKEAE